MQVTHERSSDAFFSHKMMQFGIHAKIQFEIHAEMQFLHTRWFKRMRQARDSDIQSGK